MRCVDVASDRQRARGATTKAENAARKREDRLLLERYHHSRDRRHRDELVERFMPLARKLARRYNWDAESLNDLTQVAAVGLIKAVDRFDPSRGIAFSSYAVPTIVGELKRHFRDYTWSVRPPRDLQERALRAGNAIEQFAVEHGRAPTVAELAERLDGLDEEDVLEALHARRAATTTSLEAPLGRENGDDDTLGDRVGCEDDGFRCAEQRVLLDGLMRAVSARERAILSMRFIDDMTQAEIGEIVGVSQMQISRILRQSVEQLGNVAQAQYAGQLQL